MCRSFPGSLFCIHVPEGHIHTFPEFTWCVPDSRTVSACHAARPDPFDFQLGVGLRQDGHASTRPMDIRWCRWWRLTVGLQKPWFGLPKPCLVDGLPNYLMKVNDHQTNLVNHLPYMVLVCFGLTIHGLLQFSIGWCMVQHDLVKPIRNHHHYRQKWVVIHHQDMQDQYWGYAISIGLHVSIFFLGYLKKLPLKSPLNIDW